MTKVFKSILISLFGAITFMFAGFFFAGCDVDYSKIQLVGDKAVVELEVGQEDEVVFSIEGFQSGFSNKVNVNALSDGQTAIFEASSPTYISDNQFKIKITASAGGNGRLVVSTYEAGKSFEVDVHVTQFASTLSINEGLLYASNETSFVPSANLFTFDSNTTNKDLSYYYLPESEINFTTSKLTNFADNIATFSDGVNASTTLNVKQFDRAVLDEDNSLILSLNGEIQEIGILDSFKLLAIYSYSINNPKYENILYAVDDVYLFPNLDVDVKGGYLIEDEIDSFVEIGATTDSETDGKIIIVPNNSEMVSYVMRVEMLDVHEDTDVRMSIEKSNDNVVVDFFDYAVEEGNFKYIKISQATQIRSTTNLTLRIYYNLAQQVDDQSVNVVKNFLIETQIEPKEILVNGKSTPDDLTLYYIYTAPQFGWNDLYVDVISNFATSPNFEGVYFEFDPSCIDMMYDNSTVQSGRSKIYSDLTKPFRVRGKGREVVEETEIVIHVVSDLLQDELTKSVKCKILEGARILTLESDYLDQYNNPKTLYIDMNDGKVDFSEHMYANNEFQSFTSKLSSGIDVVDFVANNGANCKENGGKYYLNASIMPKKLGTGKYTIFLDNGTSIELVFSVVNSLKEESTFVQIVSEENSGYTFSSLERTEGARFDNVLNIEILNLSANGEISFGRTATFEVLSNADRIEYVIRETNILSLTKDSNKFKISTRANGDATITLNLTGNYVEDFAQTPTTVMLYVNVSSYALVEEFYLKNGDNYALYNTLYYGLVSSELLSIDFSANANNVSANNFYQYQFVQSMFPTIYNNAIPSQVGNIYEISSAGASDYFSQNLVHEAYDDKFVYFYALSSRGNALGTTETEIEITRSYVDQHGQTQQDDPKIIKLRLKNGLMFYAENFIYEVRDTLGDVKESFDVEFSNVFNMAGFGDFDLNTFKFTYNLEAEDPPEFVISANLGQRNLTKRYDAHIFPTKYIPVENISSLASMTRIDFTNKKLNETITVALYPTNATSKDIRVEFVTTNANPYDNMLSWKIDDSQKENGIYKITLSCEEFFNNPDLRGGDDIVDIEDSLTGLLYIYPLEWGTNYSSIASNLHPIKLDVQLRNGSENNPYILETAEDVLSINTNETTLRSHYEINGVVDMSAVKDFKPIGILGDELVGFSGSIVGTTSQAEIVNLSVKNDNLFATIGTNSYAGLFAKINDGATLENFSVSGKVELSAQTATTYASLLTAQNFGRLINVGTKLTSSSISGESGKLYFGVVAGVNLNEITQDIKKYEEQTFEIYKNNQTPRNLVFITDGQHLTVDASGMDVFVGGVVGANGGEVERISPSTSYKLYGYVGYSAYVNIKVTDADNAYVGAIAGISTYYNNATYLPTGGIETESILKNLLAGGEISTISISSGTDFVGGIVGYVSANGSNASVLENTSRVFLRGKSYVGGIAGFDLYSAEEGSKSEVIFGNKNKIEAVDDGRRSVLSANIIRQTLSGTLPTLPEETDDNEVKAEKQRNLNVFYALGNATTSGRAYYSGYNYQFFAYSYLIRNKETANPETSISPESGSTGSYYGDLLIISVDDENYKIENAYTYEHKDVNLELESNGFDMALKGTGEAKNVFFMYYFSVATDLAGEFGALAQDEISDLNKFNPNSVFYPFKLDSQDVSLNVSSSSLLAVDLNGNMTVYGTGLASVTLSSILNTQVSKEVYIYIVNYFDKDVTASILYTTPTTIGTNIKEGDQIPVRGNSHFSVYVVPSYSTQSFGTYDQLGFGISESGILTYQNVSYVLTKNTEISIDFTPDEIPANYFSTVQKGKQSLLFSKASGKTPNEGDTDEYTLCPMFEVVIGEQTYIYALDGNEGRGDSEINVEVKYKETATGIYNKQTYHSMQTNGYFEDTISIISTNANEKLFYEIVGVNDFVQSRLPKSLNDVSNYGNYMQIDSNKDLFILEFTQTATNTFNLVCKVNTNSEDYKNRYVDGKSIFGEYVFTFYSSELEDGVHCSFRLTLDEATLSYVSLNNYSNLNNLSATDQTVVPTQRGMLEIVVDPVDCVFNQIYVSNNEINSKAGAGQAVFSFFYQKQTEAGGVEYVALPDFGRYEDGAFTFTYEQMIARFDKLNEGVTDPTKRISYLGKIYIGYIMPSSGVEDGVDVAFDVKVTHGNAGEDEYSTSINLQTKLGSFARLTFDDKEQIGDYYYLARGLSYGMTLEAYGFDESQIDFQILDGNGQETNVVSIEKIGGRYVLKVDANYSSSLYNGEAGVKVTLKTHALKIVDNVKVETVDTLEIYLMEYVLNYDYTEGENEDIVKGMQDGIISIAIGNPYTLAFEIRKFLEYDAQNSDVARQVETFVVQMTANVDWKVYENGEEKLLEQGTTIKSKLNYYQISSFTVTPIRIYNPESNIYHFSVSGFYLMRNGIYATSTSSSDTPIYTEFSFDVHEQSTQDSPIPVENYEDLMKMQAGEWYILTDNIVLPSAEYASQNGVSQFMPISTEIAGLDGNNKKLKFAGTYNFDGLENVGLFDTVVEGTILQNITIQLSASATFKMNVETFNVGLLASTSDGIVTNCSVEASGTSSLSVDSAVATTSSYVAGLVAENNGYITNSRSKVNIVSNVNLSGFVGRNNGHIASSYFRGGSLKNDTNTTNEYTAGFVVENNGKIYTSYVSGDEGSANTSTIYYAGTDDYIQASGNISGFVYSNDGKICDSYSNIHLMYSGFFASGFVFENTGRVERCFSTSILESEQTRNYGFVRTNSVDDETSGNGIFDCYYLSDEFTAEGAISSTKLNKNLGEIAVNNLTNVTPLTIAQFAYRNASGNVSKFFQNFVAEEGRKISSVWFFNNLESTDNFNNSFFNRGRLELVAPNIVATSERELDHAEEVVDEASGASYVRYIYVYKTGSAPLGSMYNPILISNAEEFETYILRENNSANYNSSHYRLISDVDYGEYLYNSVVYSTKFLGYLEGNFMIISGQTLLSSNSMNFAGMFAEVGSSSIASDFKTTVMNFTLAPKVVDFANTDVVGAIAGVVDNANVLNISLEGEGTIVGNNIVGGAIGLTLGDFKLQNVYSQYCAKARNQAIQNLNNFDKTSTNYKDYSFAGSLVGVMSGSGTTYNCVTDTIVSAIADKAGLMFGFVDEGVSVAKVRLHIDNEMLVNGRYVGLVVGESKGDFEDVVVYASTAVFDNFKQTPYSSTAIGGFAGLVSGGTLDNIETMQSIKTSTESSSKGVTYLGGIAGEISSTAKISNIMVDGVKLTGFQYVGGVAGAVTCDGQIDFKNIQVISTYLSAVGVGQTFVGVGGLAGYVDYSSIISLTADPAISVTDSVIKKNAEIVAKCAEIDAFEDEMGETPTEEQTANLERLNEELTTLQAELKLISKNNFEMTIYEHVYVYGTDAYMNVGAILGYNNAFAGHTVSDTNSTLDANCTMIDLSDNTYVSKDCTLSVAEDGTKTYDKTANFGMFNVVTMTATDSTFSGKVAFSTSYQDSYPLCILNVNLNA